MIRWLINLLNRARPARPEYAPTNTAHRAATAGMWRRPWDAPNVSDSIGLLAAAVNRGMDCWAAREPGTCCSCGHEWIAGEIIGTVYQAYRRNDDGTVTYDPQPRRACCVCVEQQRVEGDLSQHWHDGGSITTVGGLDAASERIARGGFNPHE